MKTKQKGAQKGHSLLKRKSDALSARFRIILAKIRAAKHEMGELMRGAALAMAQVNYAAGDISFAVRESVSGPAQFQVQSRVENVSGVQLPVFEAHIVGTSNASSVGTGASGAAAAVSELTAISRGGQQVQKCRETNVKVLQTLLSLASLQTAFHILDSVIRVTNRRVNALEYVVLPRTENTISYISAELDEQDREEFFRLKKIQSKKKTRQQQEEYDAKCRADASEEECDENDAGRHDENSRSVSLLDVDADPDIIF